MTSRAGVFGVALALTAAACNPHKVTRDPAPPVTVTTAFTGGREGQVPDKWWAEFGDASLNSLIDSTLTGNLQLEAAWARLEQAQSLVRQASSGKWPQLEASLSGQRQRQRSFFADADELQDQAGLLPETVTFNSFSASVGVAYELDLWKRVSSQAAGAALDAAAVRDDAEAIAMSLAAEVSEAWFDLVYQRARRALLEQQVEVSETFLELVTLRFRQGLATSLDVNQQRQQVVSTRAQLPLTDLAAHALKGRLSVLTGGEPVPAQPSSPADVSAAVGLPSLPPLPGTGIPADLLDRRPDVRAARRRAEAADHRVASAVADRLPSLRLSGSIGKQSGDVTEIFTVPTVWSIIGQLVAPLFDGGRRAAEVDRNRAVVRERLANYGQVLIQAIAEVETALAQEQEQLRYIAELEQQVEVAGSALGDARQRYRQGLSEQGFLQVLSALQGQQASELALLQARRQLLSFRIQLCRALGGTWTRSIQGKSPRGDK